MKFQTHNDTNIRIIGTCLQGYIDIEYDILVKLFGEPIVGDEYKIDAEWEIIFEDGTVATIYNYKDGYNYCGEHAPYPDITKKDNDWHIGGSSKLAVEYIERLLKE
jgi:hypothetical protein